MEASKIHLIKHTPEGLRALLKGTDVPAYLEGIRVVEGVRDFLASPDVSPEYLSKLEASTVADPWTHGFAVIHLPDRAMIGMAGYKGPPGIEGVVEIAYAIVPAYQGRGYATEGAGALVSRAFDDDKVRVVIAHTLPEKNASTRVLQKCGFKLIGEVMDPEDGRVWRWEFKRE
jgi:RimJ/RimL family protein N-acetyltransferase